MRNLSGDVDQALEHIRLALALDSALRRPSRDDADFVGIRHDPRFRALVDTT